MEHLEFIRLGVDNLLPRSMQEIFDNLGDFVRPKENTTSLTRRRSVSKFGTPDRWKPSGWSCNCRNTSTVWVPSNLRFADNLQIYCDACNKLAGGGQQMNLSVPKKRGSHCWSIVLKRPSSQNLNPLPSWVLRPI